MAERGKDRYDPAMAAFLARVAAARETVSYSDFAAVFGLANQGCGPVLNDIARRLYRHRLPLLPVLVVRKGDKRPSPGAGLYAELGIRTDEDMDAEIKKCHDHNWSDELFMKGKP